MPYDPSLLTPLPDIDQYIDEMAAKYRLDRNFFRANLSAESGENVDVADSPRGAAGIGQIMPGTFAEIKKALPHLTSVRDPYSNIEASAYYLDQLLNKYDGDYDLAIAAYNAGPGAVDKYGGIPPFPETMKHVEKVRNKALGIAGEAASQKPMLMSQVAQEMATPWYRKFGHMIEAPFTGVGELTGNMLKGAAIETELAKKDYGPLLAEAMKYAPVPTTAPPAVPPETTAAYQIGKFLSGDEKDVPADVRSGYPYQILKQLGYTTGQIASVIGAYGLGSLAGPTVGANLALLTSVGQPVLSEQAEMYERGRQQGVPVDVSLDAASEAAHLGLLDALGTLGVLGTTSAILRRAGASVIPAKTGNVFKQLVGRVSTLAAKYPRTTAGVLSAIEEAMTEIPQGYLEDNIAIEHFNEVVDRYNNAKDAGIIAGAAGGIMGFLLAAIGIKLKTGKWRIEKPEIEREIKMPKPEAPIELKDVVEEGESPVAPEAVSEEPPVAPTEPIVAPEEPVALQGAVTPEEPVAAPEWQGHTTTLESIYEHPLYEAAIAKEYSTEARARAASQMYSERGLLVYPMKVGDVWKLVHPENWEPSMTNLPGKRDSIQQLNAVEKKAPEIIEHEELGTVPQKVVDTLTAEQLRRDLERRRAAAATGQPQAVVREAALDEDIVRWSKEYRDLSDVEKRAKADELLESLSKEQLAMPAEQAAVAEPERPKAAEPKYMKYVRSMQEGATLERNSVLSTGEKVPRGQLLKMQKDGVIDFNVETQRFELMPEYRTEKSVEGVVAPDYEEYRRRREERLEREATEGPGLDEVYGSRITKLYSFNPLHIPTFAKHINKFVDDLFKDPREIKTLKRFAEDDATFLAKYWKQSWWYTKDKPALRRILDASLKRVADSTNNTETSLKSLDGYRALSGDQRRLADKILVTLDGRPYVELGITEPHFVEDEDGFLQSNEGFYEQYRDYIQQLVELNYKGDPGAMVQAIVDIRRGLDDDRRMLYNSAKKSGIYKTKTIDNIKADAFIPNYYPHTRYGEMVIEGYVWDEKEERRYKVYDTAVDMSVLWEFVPKGMSQKVFDKIASRVMIPKIKENLAAAGIDVDEISWEVTKRDNVRLHHYENQPLLIAMLNDVVESAVSNVEDQRLRGVLESVFPSAIVDALRKGGWGHFARRKNIPGYETKNVGKVLYDYKVGLYSLLAKAEAAESYSRLLRDVEGVDRRKWAVTFVKDDLAPMSKVDKAVGTIRLLAYAKYMGMSLKNPIVNLSNMVNQGSPVLAMDVGPVADKFLVKAISKIAGRRLEPLDPMRERLLRELFSDGVIKSQYIREVKSDLGTRPGYDRVADTVLRIVTLPMELTEVLSRSSTALAAYDAMAAGKIKNAKRLEELGIKRGQKFLNPTEEEYQKLKKYAETVVLDSHSLYGRQSKPTFARTGVVGRAVSAAYIFTHFTQHLVHLYGYMLRQMLGGNMNAGYALVRSLIGTVAFGGLMTLPLAATLCHLYRRWLPKELRVAGDDPMQTLVDKLPPGWDDVMQYGLPALGGVTVGTSLSLELPTALEDFFGVPVSMMKDVYTMKKAWDYGDRLRALEAVVPLKLLRDYLTARRLSTEGLTTITGKPVGPGLEAAKLTKPEEIVGKIAGFQPVSMQKIRDLADIEMDLVEYVDAEKTKLSARLVRALRQDDDYELQRVIDELDKWNDFWLERDKPEYTISIKKAVQEKLRVEQPPKRMRGMFGEMGEKRRLIE